MCNALICALGLGLSGKQHLIYQETLPVSDN